MKIIITKNELYHTFFRVGDIFSAIFDPDQDVFILIGGGHTGKRISSDLCEIME
jgi:hypothetical protein